LSGFSVIAMLVRRRPSGPGSTSYDDDEVLYWRAS
jgi:hypothetical protein